MCVCIVPTPMRSKMKCVFYTLRQTVTVLHSMCIAHMTFSEKYIIYIFSYIFSFFNAINA